MFIHGHYNFRSQVERKETTVAYHPFLESTSCDFASLHRAIEESKSTNNLLVSHEPHQISFINVPAPNPIPPLPTLAGLTELQHIICNPAEA